ncbi:OsmC family protein [Brackiella oedipodis]|uniref:OsmC family protein n=1 Tax=Brackiella oedipodis TaxID=124225 RepID=UPI00048C1FD1|nr:OsmC family protein [Brackiella oedipodis]
MKCTTEWHGPDGMLMVSKTGTGHVVAMDGSLESGGNNLAASPMELLLSGASGCSSFDIISILKRSRENIQRCQVNVSAERRDEHPRIFSKIHFEFIISGRDLKTATVERAVHLSLDKYCSAIAILSQSAEVTHSIAIHDTAND